MIFALGAHSDDIEIGCGGDHSAVEQAQPKPRFCWVVFSARGARHEEAQKAAEQFTAGLRKRRRSQGLSRRLFAV